MAQSQEGNAQGKGLSKSEAGYSPGKGLRGRKIYPHHARLPDGYWSNPTQDRTQQPRGQASYYQEYRRPRKNGQEQRDDQNRSVLGWVKPGAQFSFSIYVQNASEVELGALLWLLELPADHFFRFGGGKPLGFGSVRLEIEACDLHSGEALRQRYSAWHAEAAPGDPRQQVIPAFKKAVVRAFPSVASFDHAPFVEAFLTACRGYSDHLPVHYPRATEDGQPGPPSPDGESFKWFVANERPDARYALPELIDDRGLPTLKSGG